MASNVARGFGPALEPQAATNATARNGPNLELSRIMKRLVGLGKTSIKNENFSETLLFHHRHVELVLG